MSDRYIVAVEISSSKIIAAVGLTSGDGNLDVIAVEQESGVEAVRYGVIQNLDETAMKLGRLIKRLEQHPQIAPKKIKGVYVGLSGKSLKSIPVETERNLPEDTEIDNDIIDSLRVDARRTAIDNTLEVVDAVPRIYRVGKTETHSPKGMIGNRIEGTFDLIVCRPELKRNINRVIVDKLGLRVEGFVVTALAYGHLILTPDEKRLGCMLVDMGAETTTVTIYKDGCLQYFVTIPMGARLITRDITSLNVLEERAEIIKLQSGKAIISDSASSLNINGLKLSDVNNLVVARSEEIVANIVEQMEYAGLNESKLPGGIICIGGGARLSEMMELVHIQSNLPVRRGELPKYVVINDVNAAKLEYIEVVSVMYAGATLSNRECLEMPAPEAAPPVGDPTTGGSRGEREERQTQERATKRGGIFSNFTTRLSKLFKAPDEDDSDLIDE